MPARFYGFGLAAVAEKRVKIVQDTQDATIECLTSEIKAISEGVRALRAGRLNDKALLLLIEHAMATPRPGKKAIQRVLDALGNLEATYLKGEE